MDELKVGDVVHLKSDPYTKMTIEKVGKNDAICVWFHELEIRRDRFSLAAIKRVEPVKLA
jgi:uncharacterized protein YodC (DUF2158 family)